MFLIVLHPNSRTLRDNLFIAISGTAKNKHMKIRVYFCREIDPEFIIQGNKISRQALDTIYDLVWEGEFKNILNVGRVWLKFKEEERPFGIPMKEKRSHSNILPGDIIQIANDFYMASQVGARQIVIF